MKIETRIFRIENPTNAVIGRAAVTFDDGAGFRFCVKGLAIVNGQNGPFVVFPSRKDKNGTYRDVAFPCTKETREAIVSQVMAEWNK